VNVNTAPAEEIATVLGLPAKDAAAIVEYRKANGKFADVATLVKVSPLVKTKVDEQPEAVMFE
jgi:competence ComEA-like helix-hairpin-helix protein